MIAHWDDVESGRAEACDPGLAFLADGTRRLDDVCSYPRSNKIYVRGLGLIARLEDLDYDDGEPR